MDRFILLIAIDAIPSVEQQHLIDYVNSSFSNHLQLTCRPGLFSNSTKVFLPSKASFYFSSVIISQSVNATNWIRMHETVDRSNLFPDRDSEEHIYEKNIDKQLSSLVARTIHNLADDLPCCGIYNFEILVSSGILSDVDISDHVHLIGALQRQHMWHGAQILIVPAEGSEANFIWSEILGSGIIPAQNEQYNSPLLWRGEINLSSNADLISRAMDKNERWELRLDSRTLFSQTNTSDVHTPGTFQAVADVALIFSESFEVLDECCLTSIPFNVFSSPVMKLYLSAKDDENENGLEKYLSSKPGMALIMRLKYSKVNRSKLSRNLLTTEKWKKAVISGNLQSAATKKIKYVDHLIFAVTKLSPCLPIMVYHVEGNADICLSYILGKPAMEVANSHVYSSELEMIPDLNDLAFHKYMKIIETTCQDVVLQLSGKVSNCDEDSSVNVLSAEDVTVALNDLKKRMFPDENYRCLKPSSQDNITCFHEDSEKHGDPWDWPERAYLLQQQIERDRCSKKEDSDQFLLNKASWLTASDVRKCFKDTGEPVEAKDFEIIKVKKTVLNIISSYQSVAHTEWPEVLSLKCHDVYYNVDTDEEALNYDQIKSNYFVQETASFCSHKQSSQKYCSHGSSSSSSSLGWALKREHSTTKKDSQRELRRKVLKLSADSLDVKTTSISKDGGRRRNNPQSKQSVNTRSEKTTKSQKSTKKSTTAADLSEKHKMKLREAVVFALEKYAISFSHALFKPCAKKLFAVCKPFVMDVTGKGNTSMRLKDIASSHAQQVVDFEKKNLLGNR